MPASKSPASFDFADPQDELIEVVDEHDEPVLVVSALEARRQKLRRRVILVLLHDAQGRLYLQRRGEQKSAYPGAWDVSASGHVRAGEAREDAARRELYEELGVRASGMAYLASYATTAEHGNTQVTLFHATAPAARPAPDNKEVTDVLAVEEHELAAMVNNFGEGLTPALLWVFRHGYAFNSVKPESPGAGR